jgi:hypothetical protein
MRDMAFPPHMPEAGPDPQGSGANYILIGDNLQAWRIATASGRC